MKDNGEFHKAGDMITNKKLGETLKLIADDPDTFYSGKLAESIVQDMNDKGGNWSLDDLKNYEVLPQKPLDGDLQGMNVYYMPPPGSGAVVAMIMNILEGKISCW